MTASPVFMQQLLICASWCLQNPEYVQMLLPHFQNCVVVLGMVCAKPRANTSKIPSCLAHFMALISVDVWCVPNRILLDKAKHELAHSVIPTWEA